MVRLTEKVATLENLVSRKKSVYGKSWKWCQKITHRKHQDRCYFGWTIFNLYTDVITTSQKLLECTEADENAARLFYNSQGTLLCKSTNVRKEAT